MVESTDLSFQEVCQLEYRTRIVSLDPRLIVQLLNWWRDPPHWIALPENVDLPADVTVVSVTANWERGTIDALVRHPSFPIVEAGQLPPRSLDLITTLRSIPVANNEATLIKTREQILSVARCLSFESNGAVVDTIWMPGDNPHTAVEELCDVAHQLGASDQEIEAVAHG